MTVNATISEADLKGILLGYDLGDLIEVGSFATGTLQTNLLLTTDTGRYAFRLYENRTADYVAFELELLRYLWQKKYPCPAPIPDTTGSVLGTRQGKPWALFTLMKGTHDDDPDHYRQVAEAIGKLHELTQNLRLSKKASRDTYDPVSCLRNAKGNLGKVPSPEEAQSRLTWIQEQVGDIQLPEQLPMGVCHCDPNPTNFLYLDGKLSAVLDFDMAAYVPLLYDVSCLIYWWACAGGHDISFPRVREILAAYQGVRPLTNMERRHLYDVLKMVMLMGSGWFAAADDFWTDTRGVERLNAIGRAAFYEETLGN